LGETPEAALPADQTALEALDRTVQANLPALLFIGEIAEPMKRKAAYIINTTKAYALLSLQLKLKERSDFETTIKNMPIAILEATGSN
jgi:hypothetical protein